MKGMSACFLVLTTKHTSMISSKFTMPQTAMVAGTQIYCVIGLERFETNNQGMSQHLGVRVLLMDDVGVLQIVEAQCRGKQLFSCGLTDGCTTGAKLNVLLLCSTLQ